MIALIEGTLVAVASNHVVILCHGVGYRVNLPGSLILELPAVNHNLRLYTHHLVRDDHPELYGFTDQLALEIFTMLIGVSSIGPKIALAALSTITPSRLVAAIAAEDEDVLSSISGVGKKTAKRMILELRDKMSAMGGDLGSGSNLLAAAASGPQTADAMEALVALGYGRTEAHQVVMGLVSADGPKMTVEQVIKAALKILSS